MTNISEKDKNDGVICIEDLPDDVQAVVQKMNINKDGNGTLDADELGTAFKDCKLLCE